MAFLGGHASADTVADIQGVALLGADGLVCTVSGLMTYSDHLGGQFRWSDTETSADDGVNIIRPTAVDSGDPGRWVRLFFHYHDSQPGFMKGFGGSSDPVGWFICDGRTISRTTYSDLFSAIGTAYGAGDGSSTFKLPDYRDRFMIGKAASGPRSTLGVTGGAMDHTHGSPLTTSTPSATQNNTALLNLTPVPSDTHTHSVTIPGDNPPFQTANIIIKI